MANEKVVRNWKLCRTRPNMLWAEQVNGFHSYSAIRYPHNGLVVWDYPERVPQYVKDAAGRMLNQPWEV